MKNLAGLLIIMASLIIYGGCSTSTKSGMPEHITSIEVDVFQNKTMYKGLEGKLTRYIIDKINQDARITAVSNGANAAITGEIIEVTRVPVRETVNDRPATVQINIKVRYSFWDDVERKYIIEDATVSSQEAASVSGLYEQDRGEVASSAENSALDSLAGEIVRRTLGMW